MFNENVLGNTQPDHMVNWVGKALLQLIARGNRWTLRDDSDWSTLEWDEGNPDDPPTEAEVAELAESLRSKGMYRQPRKKEYPNTNDQMDMIYHDMKDGTTTHADAIEVIKNKYPKSLAD